MSFDRGSMKFRVFDTSEVPDDFFERLTKHALPDIRDTKIFPTFGFTSPDHALDRFLTEEKVRKGGVYHFQFVIVEKRVPSKLLTARIREAQLARAKQKGGAMPRGKELAEIRRTVSESLLGDALPAPQPIECLLFPRERLLLADALGDSLADALWNALSTRLGLELRAWHPMLPKDATVRPAHFARIPQEEMFVKRDLEEFLAWAWLSQEALGRIGHTVKKLGGVVTLGFEGPFRLIGEDDKVCVIEDGPLAQECGTAIRRGALLCSARVMYGLAMERHEDGGTLSFDAVSCAFRSVKPVPTCNEIEMRSSWLLRFVKAWRELWAQYAEARISSRWAEIETDIQVWVAANPKWGVLPGPSPALAGHAGGVSSSNRKKVVGKKGGGRG